MGKRMGNMSEEEYIQSLEPIVPGMRIRVPKGISGKAILRDLSDRGYTAYLAPHYGTIFVEEYISPATRDAEGFFIEDEALDARIRRELKSEPYNRHDGNCFPLLLTDEQRGSCENVIGFIRGIKKVSGYQPEFMYMALDIFLYTNLDVCFRKVISTFDIYGFDCPVTCEQWEQIKDIANRHGNYAKTVVGEIDDWLSKDSVSCDPIMTIMCI